MTASSIESLWSRLWQSRMGPKDIRLRFQLGGDEFHNTTQTVPRFLQAHHRASAIADALFEGRCVGIVAWHGRRPDPEMFPGAADGFEALRSTGFHPEPTEEWQATPYPDPGGDEAYGWTLRSYDLGGDKIGRDVLLWHAIADEMPIHPSAPVVTFLIDPDREIMLHVYDDRGMDVIAGDAMALRQAYSTFADWLLDHDRDRMARMFELRTGHPQRHEEGQP